MSEENDYLPTIENTYRQIDDNFDDLLAACKNEEQRNQVITARDSARKAYWAAVAKDLSDNSELLMNIHADLIKANNNLDESLQSMDNIVAVIGTMEEAIKLAASLAILAAG